MHRAFVVALPVLLVLAPRAAAQKKKPTLPDPRRWLLVDSAAAWIDTTTVSRQGRRVTVWVQSIVHNPYRGKGMPKLAMLTTRQELDCDSRTSRATTATLRTATGELLDRGSQHSEPEPVQPETEGELILRRACSLPASRAP